MSIRLRSGFKDKDSRTEASRTNLKTRWSRLFESCRRILDGDNSAIEAKCSKHRNLKDHAILKPGNSNHEKAGLLCERCLDINFIHRLNSDEEPYSWWYEAHGSNSPSPQQYVEYLSKNAFNLGRYSDIQFGNECPGCRMLKSLISSCICDREEELFLISAWAIERVEWGIDIARQSRPGPERPTWSPGEDSEVRYAKLLHVARKFVSSQQYWTFAHEAYEALAIVGQTPNAAAFGGRKVEKNVDFNQLTGWINLCIKSHPDTCPLIYVPELESIRLIDVEKRKVIRYIPKAEYLCLSYVWGDVRQRNQGLGALPSRLPATIEDAITVVRSLQKRYLWVDSVCIEQEDSTHKISQINLMGLIYRCAWVTIVALSGDSANAGLGRINSRHPSNPQEACYIGDICLVTLMPTLDQQISESQWAKRAWTLQEGQISPRCLYFTPQQVYFECISGQCSESVQDCETPPHRWMNTRRLITRYNSSAQRLQAPGVFGTGSFSGGGTGSILALYEEHIREYMGRKLTYESDTINAISGLLQQLQEKGLGRFDGGFFWGLPVDYLPFALMWYESDNSHKRNGMPTWSWAHREGPLARIVVSPKDPPLGPNFHTYLYHHSFPRTMTFESRCFINFQRVDNGNFKTIYADDPTNDSSFNQNSWGNPDRIKNLGYTMASLRPEKHTLPFLDPGKLLFVEGLVFRPLLSQIISSFELDDKAPSEEHVFKFSVRESRCWLTCYTREISEYVLTTYKQPVSQPLYLLILHREFQDYFWYYDLLLLNCEANVSTRLGPLKLCVPTHTRMDVFKAFRPAWATLAIA